MNGVASQDSAVDNAAMVVRQEAARRRTFAVISHPDAGKSTITEALALHAQVIGQAGAVHGKAGRRGVVSDWMAMERTRGISITSAVLQFAYRDLVVNLLAPGSVEELELLAMTGADHDPDAFATAQTTPVLFGSAVASIGVRQLLDVLTDHAPPPTPRVDHAAAARPLEAPFSGFVFKIQANMNPAHRDQVAFVRVCSGRFERGMVVTHAGTGRPFATKYAQQIFGRDRDTIDHAYPGDVIGLVNATTLGIGDTLYTGPPVRYPPLPSFAPEHFAVIRTSDTAAYKRFRRGIGQLDAEGVVQVLRSDRRGEQAPVLAAVGPMQFDVALARLAAEFHVLATIDHLPYELARRTDRAGEQALQGRHGVEVLTRVRDGARLALFPNPWRLKMVTTEHPDLMLEPLLADTTT